MRIRAPPNGEKSDAIAILLNRLDGYSAIVLFPYKIDNGKAVIKSALFSDGRG